MTDKDFLLKHIEKIFDYYLNEINFNHLELKYEKRKYSSNYSYVLYLDNNALTRDQFKTYKVQYLCRCGRHITILLQKYLCKKNICCHHCMQNRSFEFNVKTKPYELKKGIRQKVQIIKKEFNEYDDIFKLNYAKHHLTEIEFYKYLPYIYSIGDIILNDDIRNNIIYKYADHCNNQKKFTSYISYDNGLNYIPLKQFFLKCNTCGKIFGIHNINLKNKNIYDIKCKQCNFFTKPYLIKKHDLINATYQSKIEKYFLDLCYHYGIHVMNGLKIPYWFNKKLHTYITDFYLPDHKIILELKGCNPYFIKDLKSGKIEAKNAYAAQYAKEHNMKFRFIRDYDILNFIKKISNFNKKYELKYYYLNNNDNLNYH